MNECENCDFKNPVWKGRWYAVCPKCWRDYTIELMLILDSLDKDE